MARPYAANARLAARAGSGGTWGKLALAVGITLLGWWLIGSAILATLGEDAAQGVTRGGFLINVALFLILITLTARVARAVHGREWSDLLGERTRLLSDFLSVLGACGIVYAIFITMGLDTSGATMRPLAGWLMFLPFALMGILVQSLAEEVFYRGYLHQQVAAMDARPWVWLLVPSLIFGLSHALNDTSSAATAISYIVWTTAFGIACADLTARTGSIGAGWGLHVAVNIAALCIASQTGAPLSAAALFLFPERAFDYVPETSLIVMSTLFELAFLAVLWLAARNAIRR